MNCVSDPPKLDYQSPTPKSLSPRIRWELKLIFTVVFVFFHAPITLGVAFVAYSNKTSGIANVLATILVCPLAILPLPEFLHEGWWNLLVVLLNSSIWGLTLAFLPNIFRRFRPTSRYS